MDLTLLLPEFDHPAIEERYGHLLSALRMTRVAAGAPVLRFSSSDLASRVIADVATPFVLVVTDPLALPLPGMLWVLRAAMIGEVPFAIPVSNESPNPAQVRIPTERYFTLRELESIQPATDSPFVVEQWNGDPGVILARTPALSNLRDPLSRALDGRRVTIVPAAYCHRFPPHHATMRGDLLEKISTDARNVLEFGCGDGVLGAALKARQPCRVVGVEIDSDSATLARTRLDTVHQGDVRDIIATLTERFDWIVGGDIVEHLDDPWTFLRRLRSVAEPGATLLLSIPNLGNASIVNDLLHGRFDYVYMGILSSGHVRLFTRQTIVDMLDIAGWDVVSVEGFAPVESPASARLRGLAIAGGLELAPELEAAGLYVIARNR